MHAREEKFGQKREIMHAKRYAVRFAAAVFGCDRVLFATCKRRQKNAGTIPSLSSHPNADASNNSYEQRQPLNLSHSRRMIDPALIRLPPHSQLLTERAADSIVLM